MHRCLRGFLLTHLIHPVGHPTPPSLTKCALPDPRRARKARRLSDALTLRAAIGALLGGLLMGYGASLAGGCNIGAYVAGVASGSLHGWVWGGFAMLGCVVGLPLRWLLRLPIPHRGDVVCP